MEKIPYHFFLTSLFIIIFFIHPFHKICNFAVDKGLRRSFKRKYQMTHFRSFFFFHSTLTVQNVLQSDNNQQCKCVRIFFGCFLSYVFFKSIAVPLVIQAHYFWFLSNFWGCVVIVQKYKKPTLWNGRNGKNMMGKCFLRLTTTKKRREITLFFVRVNCVMLKPSEMTYFGLR